MEADANHVLDGGPDAFRARLGQLRGYPVVVNQWASWCGPCGYEFPYFQRLSAMYSGKVAFLGVASKDGRESAERFARRFPVRFPHFLDTDASVARVFRGGRAWPTTAFYDASGTLAYTHAGAYRSEAELHADAFAEHADRSVPRDRDRLGTDAHATTAEPTADHGRDEPPLPRLRGDELDLYGSFYAEGDEDLS